jgi:hypothetical protein
MSFSPEQFERQFAPYGCRKRTDLGARFEIWVTGWGEPFVLRPLRDGSYDQDDCNRFTLTIARTMPLDWRTASEVFQLREAVERLTDEIRQLRSELRGVIHK